MQQGGNGRLDGRISRLPTGLAPVSCHADAMAQQPRSLLHDRRLCFRVLLVVAVCYLVIKQLCDQSPPKTIMSG